MFMWLAEVTQRGYTKLDSMCSRQAAILSAFEKFESDFRGQKKENPLLPVNQDPNCRLQASYWCLQTSSVSSPWELTSKPSRAFHS